MGIANSVRTASHPARSIVILSCGHQRKIRNKKAYKEFYCIACDDFHPISKILKETKDF